MLSIARIGWGCFDEGFPLGDILVRDIQFTAHEVLDWDSIKARFGGEPDMVLYVDRSLAPPLVGIEFFPCLTAFHCIDSHIHSWYPTWAQAFDLCSVSLKDHIPRFRQRLSGEQLLWLPPMAESSPMPPPLPEADKDLDLLFVGHVDPEIMPGRVRFLEEIRRRFDSLVVMQGDFRRIYPRARLVLNIAERGDLNFRVFEALGCGACLLTPDIGHGQGELFRDSEHLFTYPPGDPDALLRLVLALLPDPARREQVATRGRDLVMSHHTRRHRGGELARWILSQQARELVTARLAMRREIHARYLRLLYLHWAEALPGTQRSEVYLRYAKADS